MNRLVINADDCGRSVYDNQKIEEAIKKGLITSTTVIANMEDFSGAVRLYEKYKDRISFGIHLNLSEGEPLLWSDTYANSGFCVEEKGKMVFGFCVDEMKKSPAAAKMKYQFSPLNNEMKSCIYHELKAQIEKVKKSGIEISHIDSHSHMHLSPFILPIVCELAKENGITKMRHARNRLGYNLKSFIYRGLNIYQYYHLRNFEKTSVFCSAREYDKIKKDDNLTYELMCHPGITFGHFPEEMLYLEQNIERFRYTCKLITYREV
jgi:predicted glycoside hydrolase/deacetylase ChbG (UPF0249 family)